jgi:predicted nuclease of predicted toxin-antitoxin system
MKPLGFPLLADENIHPEVISYLRESGYDIASVSERGLSGQSDDAILNIAFQDRRIILTHDSDFGRLAILQDLPFVGIIYLRPGHIQASFTIKP